MSHSWHKLHFCKKKCWKKFFFDIFNAYICNLMLISVMLRWHSVVKNHEIWTFKVNFLGQKNVWIVLVFFRYQFRATYFVKHIFDNFNLKILLLLSWRLNLGNTVLSQHRDIKKHFVTFYLCLEMKLVSTVKHINVTK